MQKVGGVKRYPPNFMVGGAAAPAVPPVPTLMVLPQKIWLKGSAIKIGFDHVTLLKVKDQIYTSFPSPVDGNWQKSVYSLVLRGDIQLRKYCNLFKGCLLTNTDCSWYI